MAHDGQNLASLTKPPPLDPARHALFLDLDGTLVDIEAHPDDVSASPALRALLKDLALAMGGAVALVTGRTVASADSVLDGVIPNIAGIHGQERRIGTDLKRAETDPNAIAGALEEAAALEASGALQARIENKGAAFALHYRHAPEAADAVRNTAETLAKKHGLSVLEGKMVIELKAGTKNKGDAVRAFMAAPPFAGRIPVAVGDDITDEDAFAAVNQVGGFAVLVGPPRITAARTKLEDSAAVFAWLAKGVGR